MSKPLALTEEQIKNLERRVVQNWQIHRGDMEALIAMARERNEMMQRASAGGLNAQGVNYGNFTVTGLVGRNP